MPTPMPLSRVDTLKIILELLDFIEKHLVDEDDSFGSIALDKLRKKIELEMPYNGEESK